LKPQSDPDNVAKDMKTLEQAIRDMMRAEAIAGLRIAQAERDMAKERKETRELAARMDERMARVDERWLELSRSHETLRLECTRRFEALEKRMEAVEHLMIEFIESVKDRIGFKT
jgi:hypothetical protein